MTDSTSSYNLASVHDLLTAAFSAEELRRFCQGHALFQPIVANFGPNYNLNQMADEVIDYCRTYRLWDELLAAVEEKNPRQYARFTNRLRSPASPTPAPPSPPISSEPAARGFFSRPVVWIIIAALILCLILLGGYWRFSHDPSRSVPPTVPPFVPHPVVALKTTHNRYVRAMDQTHGWRLKAVSDVMGEWERYTLLCEDDDTVVALRTCHKTDEGNHRYVTPLDWDGHWELVGKTDAIRAWEKLTFLDPGTGEPRQCLEVVQSLADDGEVKVALQTWHTKDGKHRLVTAMDAAFDWVLRGETTELGPSEIFTIILLP